MMHTAQGLYDMMNKTLADLNSQIEVTTKRAENMITARNVSDGVTVNQILNRDGKPMLQDLLIAKATLLASMANLKAAERANSRPGPGRTW